MSSVFRAARYPAIPAFSIRPSNRAAQFAGMPRSALLPRNDEIITSRYKLFHAVVAIYFSYRYRRIANRSEPSCLQYDSMFGRLRTTTRLVIGCSPPLGRSVLDSDRGSANGVFIYRNSSDFIVTSFDRFRTRMRRVQNTERSIRTENHSIKLKEEKKKRFEWLLG